MDILKPLFDNTLFTWVILPILIFLSRICDVTIGTIRIIFISKGKKFLAPLLGFFEVSIWLLAISQIIQNINNIANFLAYALGFAMGNFIGVIIEEKLALGTMIIRIFMSNDETEMKNTLYNAGFGVTSVDAHGMNGNVSIIYTVIKRKDLDKAVSIIENCQSNVFYSIEDVKVARQGIFPARSKPSLFRPASKHYTKSSK